MRISEHGANFAFNEQWTAVTSVRDHKGKVTGWLFTCGCGEEKTFLNRQYRDSYLAANAERENHRCVAAEVTA